MIDIKPLRPQPSPSLLTLMPLLSRFRALFRGKSSVAGEQPPPQSLHRLPAPSQLEAGSAHAPDSNDVSLSQRYAQIAQDLRSSLPSDCRWLGPEEVDLISGRPMAAGSFADIYEGTYGGRNVVLKSYRCYVSFDIAQVVAVRCDHIMCWFHC